MIKRSLTRLIILCALAYAASYNNGAAAAGFNCASSATDCQACCDSAKASCAASGGIYDNGPLGCVISQGACAQGGCMGEMNN